MGQEVSHELFAGHLNEPFEVHCEGGPLALELTEVDVREAPGVEGLRQPFVLIFAGPRDKILAEGMYRFENGGVGSVDLYVMPIVSAGERQAYQVVFN